MVPCITKSIIMTTYFATILIIILRKQRGEISYIRGKATVHSLTLLYSTVQRLWLYSYQEKIHSFVMVEP